MTSPAPILWLISSTASFGAFVLALWASINGLGDRGLPGCGPGSGCHVVTKSRWSRFGPIPVALLGVCMYGALCVTDVVSFAESSTTRKPADVLMVLLASSCIGAACWFIFLQALILRRWCSYCMITHLFAVLGAAVALLITSAKFSNLTLVIASAGLATLIVGQVVWKPKQYVIKELLPMSDVGESQMGLPFAIPLASPPSRNPMIETYAREHRSVSLAGGRVKFDLYDFPLIGSPKAANVVGALMDFTCKECHNLHRILHCAVAESPAQLAVALFPIPLHEGCNPTVKCHRVEQAYACKFTNLAWHLWFASPDVFGLWDQFLTDSADSQPYGLSLLKARELMNTNTFTVAECDPFVEQKIAGCIAFHQAVNMPRIPAILLSKHILKGRVSDLDQLRVLLKPFLDLEQRC